MWIGWGWPKNDQTDAFLSWNDNGFPSMHLLRLHGLPSRVQCGNNLTMSEYQDTVTYTYIIEFFQAWGAKARDCTLAKRWDFRVRCVVATCGQRGMVGHVCRVSSLTSWFAFSQGGQCWKNWLATNPLWRWQSMISADTFSTKQLHMSRGNPGNPGHVSSQSSNTVLSQGCWSISSDFSVDSKNLNEKAMTLAQPKWLRLMNVYWPTNTSCILLAYLEKVQKTFGHSKWAALMLCETVLWTTLVLSKSQWH